MDCIGNLIGKGCTVSNTTATVIGLKKDQDYHFRVWAVYKNWRSTPSISSDAMGIKSKGIGKFHKILEGCCSTITSL